MFIKKYFIEKSSRIQKNIENFILYVHAVTHAGIIPKTWD